MWDLLNWRGEIAKSQRAHAPDPQIPRVDPPKVPWEAERREAPLAPHESPWLARLEAEFQGFGHKDLTLTYTHQSVFLLLRFAGASDDCVSCFWVCISESDFESLPIRSASVAVGRLSFFTTTSMSWTKHKAILVDFIWSDKCSLIELGVRTRCWRLCTTQPVLHRRDYRAAPAPPCNRALSRRHCWAKSHGPEEEFWRGT